MTDFTHLDESGKARMVDVTRKEPTERRAVAKAKIWVSVDTLTQLKDKKVPKGDVFGVARIAGIQAAKKTSELIPLCHSLVLGSLDLDFMLGEESIEITATAKTFERTGVELEALMACSVAALTIYDMCKAIDRNMSIGEIYLAEKTGGKSGDFFSTPKHQ